MGWLSDDAQMGPAFCGNRLLQSLAQYPIILEAALSVRASSLRLDPPSDHKQFWRVRLVLQCAWQSLPRIEGGNNNATIS